MDSLPRKHSKNRNVSVFITYAFIKSPSHLLFQILTGFHYQ
uniref:Uncharacterized protein n=1 Tax=Bartonella schoenbuchensis (strain DSM 13525 / NCTC 13165 / R1) TaxID=687861 RepID=E6YZ90_BARSR|nr:hypothetical protein B11C_40033 [Bartonella schoenbuchensis R1]